MSIEAIEPTTERRRVPERPVLVPPHITAAAKSLGIPATLISQAFSAGSSLEDVAHARGISQEDLVAAMEANPPANPATVLAAEAVQAVRPTVSPLAGALDVTV